VRAWQLDGWSIDRLSIVERPQPRPGPGQVLLRMKAASLNYRDLVVPVRGYGPQTGELPLVDRVFAFGELREALDYLASGAHFGKICLRVSA
jgi:NADPH:quinone reductase-like Zn-dependent oxidoreductase